MKRIAKSDYLPNLKEVNALFEEHKKTYSDDRIRERAKEDAAHDIPRSGSDEAAPFETELVHEIAALASKVASAFRSALEVLDAKIKAEELQIRTEHEHEIESINRMYDIDRDASENAFGLRDAHKQLELAEHRFNEMYSRFGRGPVRYVPHWLYLVFATAIFLGEIPLNALVFQIFGENQVMTWVMAFVIGLSVPLTAHFIGIKMREHSDGISWANAAKAFGTFAVITAALYGLSLMRQSYLGEFKSDLGLTDRLVDNSILFFWLNLAVFVAAIIVAYLAHDPVPGFEDVEHGTYVSRRAVERQEKRRVAQLIKAGKERANALSKANTNFRERMLEIVMLKGIYDQVLNEGQEHEERCLSLLGKQISQYRNENLKHRADGQAPSSFSKVLGFPLKLKDLNEKLLNDSKEVPTHV